MGLAKGIQNLRQMTRGLVIGKFMPLHAGHIALIQFAASLCDEVIVSMTYKDGDPIPGPQRFEWIREEFSHQPSIKPVISADDFDDESAPMAKRLPLWKAFIMKRFPRVDSIYSSEEYGAGLARELGASHYDFDPSRQKVPVSASMIRAN